MKIIIPIGIPGSGKTRLYHMRYNELPIVSVDIIRLELFGDVNDQLHNDMVYKESERRVKELVDKGESFFYDATNVNTRFRKKFTEQFRNKDIDVIYVVLPANVELSYKRIVNDIKHHINRAKVTYDGLLYKYQLYKESIDNNFDGENVKEIIYIKPGELD